MRLTGEYMPPQADHYDVGFCGHCQDAHVLFFNAQGTGICQAVISERQAMRLLLAIRANKKLLDPS